MAINLSIAEADNILRPRITVMGVGGAGGNAVNNMIRSQLEGCDFVAANTDAQALANSLAPRKLQLGINQTRGLGAGSKPESGRAAAEEQIADIMACLEQTDMVFVTAGMGGGTGTGAAPVIARAAREMGILTVGVVTRPFDFEGNRRRQMSDMGLADLQQYVDTLIIIPNQNLFRMANEKTTFADAFRMADEVLHCGVRGITDLMVMPGFMNLDFADVKTVMAEMGKAMMGTGEAEGDHRALRAAEAAISNPLLEDTSMKGAKGVLINITGGMDMTLFEVDQAANRIREEVDPDAQIKVGSTLSEGLNGVIRVSVIATGIEAQAMQQQSSQTGAGPGLMGGLRSMNSTPNPAPVPRTISPVVQAATAASRQPEPVTAPAPFLATQQRAFAPSQAFQQHTQQPQNPPQSFTAGRTAETPAPAAPQAAAQPAALRGQQIGNQFVAPRPMETPRSVTASAPQTAPAAAPAAARTQPALHTIPVEADKPGHSRNPNAKRAENLFTRITGFGIARPSNEEETTAMAAQPQLNVNPSDRQAIIQDEEDNLSEIPAFLRRQTNH